MIIIIQLLIPCGHIFFRSRQRCNNRSCTILWTFSTPLRLYTITLSEFFAILKNQKAFITSWMVDYVAPKQLVQHCAPCLEYMTSIRLDTFKLSEFPLCRGCAVFLIYIYIYIQEKMWKMNPKLEFEFKVIEKKQQQPKSKD